MMLILARRVGQRIVVAGDIWITVLAITPSRVDIGFEAPPDVPVDREEIHLKRQRQRQHPPRDEEILLPLQPEPQSRATIRLKKRRRALLPARSYVAV